MPETFDPYHKWLGIPPAEQPPNHYRLLAIPLFESDPDVIANAADQHMGHVRSFQIGVHTELSQRLLNEIAAARVCLLDARKKAVYDAALRCKAGRRKKCPRPQRRPQRLCDPVRPWILSFSTCPRRLIIRAHFGAGPCRGGHGRSMGHWFWSWRGLRRSW